MVKTENVKLVILLDYKNTKIFLEKVTLQISLKKFLWLKKLKILCREYITLMILTVKKLRKNCNFLWKGIAKQKSKKVFRIEKVIKVINYMLNGKDTIIRLITRKINKT